MPDQTDDDREKHSKKQEAEILKSLIQARHLCLLATSLGATNLKLPTLEDFNCKPHANLLVSAERLESTRNRIASFDSVKAAHVAYVALEFMYSIRDMLGPVFDECAREMATLRGPLCRDPKGSVGGKKTKRKKQKKVKRLDHIDTAGTEVNQEPDSAITGPIPDND